MLAGDSLWASAGSGQGDGADGAAKPPSASAPVLSLVHTLPQVEPVGSFRVIIAKGGSAVRCTEIREKRERKPHLSARKRGGVRGMSPAAARRAEFFLRSINQEAVKGCFFITQTAAPEVLGVNDWSKVERARRAWEKRFERRWGKDAACCIWKKEPHRDERPHLHRLLLWLTAPPSLKEFRDWDDLAWAESLGGPVERCRCQVQEVVTWAGITIYLRKYIGKAVKEEDFGGALTGKCWDVRWRKNAPVQFSEEVVTAEVGKRYQRALRKHQSAKREKFYRRSSVDRQWRRIRPLRQIDDACGRALVRFEDLGDQVRWWRDECGQEIKRVRPSCMMRRVVMTWASDTETGKIQPMREEVETRAIGTHFIDAAVAQRLLAFIKRDVRGMPAEGLGPVLACESRWMKDAGAVRKRGKPHRVEDDTMPDDVPF